MGGGWKGGGGLCGSVVGKLSLWCGTLWLAQGGLDVVRLNFSHGSYEEHATNIQLVRAAEQAVGRPVGILQDLCGPKVRRVTHSGYRRAATLQPWAWFTHCTGPLCRVVVHSVQRTE